MAEPFVGEIKIFALTYAPRGWADCSGQILAIADNTALFSLLSTYYGGDGRSTFALPDLRGRAPYHVSNQLRLGDRFGSETVTLTESNTPAHNHNIPCDAEAATVADPTGNMVAIETSGRDAVNKFSKTPTQSMAPSLPFGSGVEHYNMSPYLVVRFCIALQGLYPSRN